MKFMCHVIVIKGLDMATDQGLNLDSTHCWLGNGEHAI